MRTRLIQSVRYALVEGLLLAKHAVVAGVEILCVFATFTKKTARAYWHMLNRERTIENCAFLVSPYAVGPVDGGGGAYGHSLIINSWGHLLSYGGDIHRNVVAKIDLDKVGKTRGKIPALTHDWA